MFKPGVVPFCLEIRIKPVHRNTGVCNPVFINHISISRPQGASQQELRETKIKGPGACVFGCQWINSKMARYIRVSTTALYIFARYFRHKRNLLVTIHPYVVRRFFSTCLTSSRRVSLRLRPMGKPRYTMWDETVIDSLPSRRCSGWEGLSLKNRTADLEVLKARLIFCIHHEGSRNLIADP